MSKALQGKLNIVLSEKLANYLAINPQLLKKYKGYSFVVISSKNKRLNTMNLGLISNLVDEGKQVVKAVEPSKPSLSWKFTLVN